uniref:Uncharacterized protein n=1 Tax=Trypanosoma congolense (strain IL3000) TaxID=1068625 RepID=G0UNA5_TRYCI|nr:hypothetical protein, unlikely [Trypanosoma congolense IL3000]
MWLNRERNCEAVGRTVCTRREMPLWLWPRRAVARYGSLRLLDQWIGRGSLSYVCSDLVSLLRAELLSCMPQSRHNSVLIASSVLWVEVGRGASGERSVPEWL